MPAPVVTELPLRELPGGGERRRMLRKDDMRKLLRAGPVRMVVADVGEPLEWVPDDRLFGFWRDEVAPRLTEAEEIDIENAPGGYAYVASEWRAADDSAPVVVLEKFH